MRRAAVGLVVVVALVVGAAEWPIRGIVERRIATGVRSEFGLATYPDVRVGGSPFVAAALRQELREIIVTVRGEVFEGLRVEQVRVELAPVGFAFADLARGGGTARVGGGTGVATITDDAITDYLRSVSGVPLRVSFADGAAIVDATLTIAGITATASATGDVWIDGTMLRFTPTAVNLGPFAAIPGADDLVLSQLSFTTPLPELTAITLHSASVGAGFAQIAATFDAFDIAL